MSEFVNFYMSWQGCSAFGANSRVLRENEPVIFQPTDISGCAMWFDANDSASVTADEFGQVFSWANKGTIGGQFDISGAAAVQYGVAFQNGLRTISFAENAFMSGSFALDFQARSVFFVTRENTVPTGVPNPWLSSDTNGGMETFSQRNGTTVYFIGKHPSPIPEIAVDTTVNYLGTASITEFINGTDLSNNWFGINGTQYPPIYNADASGYNTSNIVYYLGGYFGGSTVASSQDFCEMIVYNHDLNVQDRIQVEDYLRRKWGIVEPVPPPFSPTDISGLQLWMDANNTGSVSIDLSSNVLSWSNVGGVGSAMSTLSGTVTYATDSNSNSYVQVATNSEMTGDFQFDYMTRTAFCVFQNLSDLTSLTYPYENLFNCGTAGGRQIGVLYDSNTTTYYTSLCQQSYNCPASGPLPSSIGIGDTNLAIWAVDSNTYLSSFCSFNSLSNINTDTNGPNLFNTSLITYSIGTPVSDSPEFRMAEVIEYDSLLTTAQISTVANYLVNKWAISSFTA